MSEGSAARIDPRFDARFQRGYVPDESVSRAEPPSAPAPSAAAAPHRTPIDAAAEADRAEEGDAELVEMLLGAGADEGRASPADPWFLGAWTVSVVALALGATLAMAGVMTESYMGPASQDDRWLQVVGWAVAPSMVQGGVLGIVVMLVWSGLRHVRRTAVDEEEPA